MPDPTPEDWAEFREPCLSCGKIVGLHYEVLAPHARGVTCLFGMTPPAMTRFWPLEEGEPYRHWTGNVVRSA